MKFKRHLKFEQGLSPVVVAPLLNVVFLVPLLFALFYFFVSPPTVDVKFPKAVTSDVVAGDNIVVIITSENVIYWRGKIIAVKDLKAQLNQLPDKKASILIKADRRASVGRIMDVWDLCRALGIERISIATNQEQ